MTEEGQTLSGSQTLTQFRACWMVIGIQGLKCHGSSLGGEKGGLGGRGYFGDERGCSAPLPKNLMDGHMGQASPFCQYIKMPPPTLVIEASFCPGHAMHTPRLRPIHSHLSINMSEIGDGCERRREPPARCRWVQYL